MRYVVLVKWYDSQPWVCHGNFDDLNAAFRSLGLLRKKWISQSMLIDTETGKVLASVPEIMVPA